jgi:hypothetical protein
MADARRIFRKEYRGETPTGPEGTVCGYNRKPCLNAQSGQRLERQFQQWQHQRQQPEQQ